ncbi:HAD-IA family hydrolase [Candidatus Uhrbacteria bacterium]|nr:HAD-IA family hydrolase [Candidatus Uhrbacteria bacterium]
MLKAFVSDFSRVLLSPKDDSYTEGLNALHKKLSAGGDYDFWSYFRLNQDLLAFFKTIGEHIDVYMFTTEYIQEHPALQPELSGVFRRVFSGARLGLKKNDAQSYRFIAKEIALKAGEILYMDDKQANLDAAKEAGMVVIHYQTNAQAKKDIAEALKNFSPQKE